MPYDGATSIWVVASRITPLDSNTFAPDPGTLIYTTDTLMKLTFAPKAESGDSVVQKNAAGGLAVAAQHDDIPWLLDVTIDLATPNPILEGLICGGSTFTAAGAALGAPTGLTTTGQTTGGTPGLAAGTYGYRAAQYNQYGQSTAENDVSVTVAGSGSALVTLSGITFTAGALGAYIFGRTIGAEKFIGIIPNLGSQATSVASGTGTVTSLTVTALTQSIPAGTTFQITGDTNSPKITFTTTAFAAVGAVTLAVTASASVTTTIAAAAIVPVLVDQGAATPGASYQTTDTTAGPGLGTGLQMSAAGVPGNSTGVLFECFSQAWFQGQQAYPQPYWRWVFPRLTGGVTQSRDLTNANIATSIKCYGRQNPNWGTGPLGDWQFDSTKLWQRARCGAEIVPPVSLTGVAATA